MIRELDPTKDILPCCRIVATNWGEAISQHFKKEVDHLILSNMTWPPVYYVAEIDNKIVGFAGMIESWVMHGIWDFIWINISPEYQRTGIGSLLTEHRLNKVEERGGKAVHLVTQKYSFFRKFGFKTAHVYQGRWALMIKELRELKL